MRDLKAVGSKFYHVLYPKEKASILKECMYIFNNFLIKLRVNFDEWCYCFKGIYGALYFYALSWQQYYKDRK